jgi:hypothetical protein
MSSSNRDKKRTKGGPNGGQFIDASPGNDSPPIGIGTNDGKKKKSVEDSKIWRDTSRGAGAIWNGYLNTLKGSWNRMTRAGQEELVNKASVIVTVGATMVTLCLFYYFLNQQLRVILLPLIGILSWFLAHKVVSPMIIERLAPYMHDE